jgi:hypothetical protein
VSKEKNVDISEVIDALEKVKTYCESHKYCVNCELLNSHGDCGFGTGTAPKYWRLNAKTYYM